MKLSDYIGILQDIQKKNGDLEVYIYGGGGLRKATEPEAKHLRILNKRESRQDYWEGWRSNCTEENKGQKVAAI